jgi:CRISPR-associated exonuclease Cas4
MPYSDEELLPISALQHLAFCERQCALIHVEREWEENQQTAEGKTLHERVDEGYREYRRGTKQFSGVYVRSLQLGIYGRLDVLELTKVAEAPDTCVFLGIRGQWELAPVEFKRGKPKVHAADRVQVCAQVLCLEEMTGCTVHEAALFYGQVRRRTPVPVDEKLRMETMALIRRLRHIVDQRLLPPPVYKKHCHSCSLVEVCQPQLVNGTRTKDYRKELFE